jgi:hypothetical protein
MALVREVEIALYHAGATWFKRVKIDEYYILIFSWPVPNVGAACGAMTLVKEYWPDAFTWSELPAHIIPRFVPLLSDLSRKVGAANTDYTIIAVVIYVSRHKKS